MTTLGEDAILKLRRLGRAFETSSELIEEAFRGVPTSWFDEIITETPPWPSGISDENAPYEFSLTFDEDETRLRFLMEPDPNGVLANNLPGMETPEHQEFVETFSPEGHIDRFVHWVACDVDGGKIFHKIYMNPHHTRGDPYEVIERLLPTGAKPPFRSQELLYISRDVLPAGEGRLKVYGLCDLKDLTAVATGGSGWTDSMVAEIRAAFGVADTPMIVTLAYTDGVVPDVTLDFPMRSFPGSDADVALLAEEMAKRHGCLRGSRSLIRSLQLYSVRDLSETRGLISHVAWRVSKGKMRMSLYISPQVYHPTNLTFAEVIRHMELRGEEFVTTPFFRTLDGDAMDLPRLVKSLKRLAFHTMTFQDIIRQVAEGCSIGEFKDLAHRHHQEEKNHCVWFFDDMKKLGVDISVLDLFDDSTAAIRDRSYRIIGLISRCRHRLAGIAATLLLEETGHHAFPRMIKALNRLSIRGLDYFGEVHMNAENGHEIFEEELQRTLSVIPLRIEEFDLLLDLADGVYQAMVEMSSLIMS